MIVKLQRFLAGNATERPWLIFDERRKCYQSIPEAVVTRKMRALLGDKDSCFVHADFDEKTKTFDLLRPAEPQKW